MTPSITSSVTPSVTPSSTIPESTLPSFLGKDANMNSYSTPNLSGRFSQNDRRIPPGIAANFAATAQTFPLAIESREKQHSGIRSEPASDSGYGKRALGRENGRESRNSKRRKAESGTFSSSTSPASTANLSPLATTSPMGSDRADTEKDKKRRNTAASARFRIKKKLKEQEMQRTIKDLEEASKGLEAKVKRLELENNLLRSLVIEKNHRRDAEEVEKLREKAKMSIDDGNQVKQENQNSNGSPVNDSLIQQGQDFGENLRI